MADITETVTGIVPHLGISLIYFTATKAAQNDTITFSGYRQVLWAAAHVFNGSSDGVVDTVTVDSTSVNLINLTGATTGTIKGVAVVIE